ncbi:hypothetical protein, partial [Enterobacter sichuanensis]
WPISRVAACFGLTPPDISTIYQWFMTAPPGLTVNTMGLKHSYTGTEKTSPNINLKLSSGKINPSGRGPVSPVSYKKINHPTKK